MKNICLILLALFLIQCTSANSANNTTKTEIKPEKSSEDGEWDLVVIDSQFDYFLNAYAKPITMYSEPMLKTRNTMLVSEWNSYYLSGRHRNVIESMIEYDPNENYGINFEYKLYQVFAYVQWRYGLRLNGLSGSEVR
ncbi:hypothetical protein CO230_11040 [Chryseobacterium sp. 6424]|nr:hypothetical protein CO230_11040 [Chryseobacterium sp. 6424]